MSVALHFRSFSCQVLLWLHCYNSIHCLQNIVKWHIGNFNCNSFSQKTKIQHKVPFRLAWPNNVIDTKKEKNTHFFDGKSVAGQKTKWQAKIYLSCQKIKKCLAIFFLFRALIWKKRRIAYKYTYTDLLKGFLHVFFWLDICGLFVFRK